MAHVLCDGIKVSWGQGEDVLAWCFPRYLKQKDACLPLRTKAREAKRGLWREQEPVAPWDFRAMKRERQN